MSGLIAAGIEGGEIYMVRYCHIDIIMSMSYARCFVYPSRSSIIASFIGVLLARHRC